LRPNAALVNRDPLAIPESRRTPALSGMAGEERVAVEKPKEPRMEHGSNTDFYVPVIPHRQTELAPRMARQYHGYDSRRTPFSLSAVLPSHPWE
jgi:hypothetical protein